MSDEAKYPTGQALPSLEEFDRLQQLRYVLELNEGDRQLTILALAMLAVHRPGFEEAARAVAARIDDTVPELSQFALHLKLQKLVLGK